MILEKVAQFVVHVHRLVHVRLRRERHRARRPRAVKRHLHRLFRRGREKSARARRRVVVSLHQRAQIVGGVEDRPTDGETRDADADHQLRRERGRERRSPGPELLLRERAERGLARRRRGRPRGAGHRARVDIVAKSRRRMRKPLRAPPRARSALARARSSRSR